MGQREMDAAKIIADELKRRGLAMGTYAVGAGVDQVFVYEFANAPGFVPVGRMGAVGEDVPVSIVRTTVPVAHHLG